MRGAGHPDHGARSPAQPDRGLARDDGRAQVGIVVQQAGNGRGEQRAGHERVGHRLERDGLVQQAATAATGLLRQGDRGQPQLRDLRPPRRQRGRVALGRPDRVDGALALGPLADGRGELGVLVTDPDRHW